MPPYADCTTTTDCKSCAENVFQTCINAYNANHPNSATITSVKWLPNGKFIATALLNEKSKRSTDQNNSRLVPFTIHGKKTKYSGASNIKNKLFDEKDEISIYGHAMIPNCNKLLFVNIEKIKSEKTARFRGICNKPPNKNSISGTKLEYGGLIDGNTITFYTIK